jgi:hypothetical protein
MADVALAEEAAGAVAADEPLSRRVSTMRRFLRSG